MKYAIWPHGSYCEASEIEQMTHVSDDYMVVDIPDEVPDVEVELEKIIEKLCKAA